MFHSRDAHHLDKRTFQLNITKSFHLITPGKNAVKQCINRCCPFPLPAPVAQLALGCRRR